LFGNLSNSKFVTETINLCKSYNSETATHKNVLMTAAVIFTEGYK